MYNYDGGVFDICHCMWSISLSLVVLLIMLMWCVWQWKYEDIEEVLGYLGAPTVVDQACIYMSTKNQGRNPKHWPEIHTTGLTNKLMFNGLPFALVMAADIAWRNEIQKNDNNLTVTYTLSIFWKVTKLLKHSFGILFMHRFDKPEPEQKQNEEPKYVRPALIQTLINEIQLATFIASSLCSVMVSF